MESYHIDRAERINAANTIEHRNVDGTIQVSSDNRRGPSVSTVNRRGHSVSTVNRRRHSVSTVNRRRHSVSTVNRRGHSVSSVNRRGPSVILCLSVGFCFCTERPFELRSRFLVYTGWRETFSVTEHADVPVRLPVRHLTVTSTVTGTVIL